MTNDPKILRERWLAAQRKIRAVTFEDVTFYVRSLTVGERTRVYDGAMQNVTVKEGKNGTTEADVSKMDTGRLQVAAVVACVCNEDGSPLFQAAEVDAMIDAPLTPLAAKMMIEAMKEVRAGEAAGKD